MIEALLSRPEGKTLDFKREEVPLDKALRTLVAFANTAGGTLVLGVADDHRVTGVRDVKVQEERYANAIASGIEPLLLPDLRADVYDGRSVLLIRVPRMPGPFHLKEVGEEEGTYVRLGSTNRVTTREQREELRRLATAQSFDERPCLGTDLDSLDQQALDRAFARTGRIPSGSLLETLGIVVRHGDERTPSNGGVILFGTEEARMRHFPNARLRGARFDGTTKARILDRFDEPASVLDGLEQVERFVRRNTRLAAQFGRLQRKDVPEYGPLALREILVNAVAHADYNHRGMSLNVFVYDDRLDVENPGGWPIGFSEDDFRAGISRRRNTVIPNVLRLLGFSEYLGSGFERIVAEAEEEGYPVPNWQEAGPILRVQMRPSVPLLVTGVTDNGTEDGREATGSAIRQEWFVAEIAAGRMPTAERLAETFSVSIRTARRDLRTLRERGIISYKGSPRAGAYTIADHSSL